MRVQVRARAGARMRARVSLAAKRHLGMELIEKILGSAGIIFMHTARYLSTCSSADVDKNIGST